MFNFFAPCLISVQIQPFSLLFRKPFGLGLFLYFFPTNANKQENVVYFDQVLGACAPVSWYIFGHFCFIFVLSTISGGIWCPLWPIPGLYYNLSTFKTFCIPTGTFHVSPGAQVPLVDNPWLRVFVTLVKWSIITLFYPAKYFFLATTWHDLTSPWQYLKNK